MSSTAALSQPFSVSLQSLNPYKQAAAEQEGRLSRLIHDGFDQAVQAVDEAVIKPVFNAIANTSRAMMDKVGKMGKFGQALFDRPGMEYGGENLVVGKTRKNNRLRADAELKSLTFSYI